jgi:hypothetical protein
MHIHRVGLLALAFISPCFAQPNHLSFSADTDSIHNPVQLPADVLTLLTSDKEDFPNGAPEHLQCSDHEKYPTQGDDPSEQLLCTTLPLPSSLGKDYLIIGVGALRGAHIVPFWIIHNEIGGPVLLLKARADGLEILSTIHNHRHELVVTSVFQAGATVRDEYFRFDGKSYKLFSSKETHN